jgi:hypothetical protein
LYAFCRGLTKVLVERGSLRLILLKSALFGTFLEVLTECGYFLYWLCRWSKMFWVNVFNQFLYLESIEYELVFQAMIIIAWSPSGSIVAFFDEDVFKSVLSIFVTSAFLNLLQGIDEFLNNFSLVQKINNIFIAILISLLLFH